ncbi:MAG: hypothetical protein DRG59_04025, partial [Deltaproteobacteria bacterium]
TYYAEVTGVTPETSRGDGNITITGHAVSRESGEELPYVRLKLGISVNGFDRYFDLATGADGKFTYTYNPNEGECGVYSVWALHPDLNFKTQQATFTIQKLYAPDEIKKNITRNLSTPVNIQVQAAQGTTIHNLSLAVRDSLPQGISITLPETLSMLEPGQKATLTFEISADDSAAENGNIVFRLTSDETPGNFWKEINFEYNIVEGRGFLTASPTFVETGLPNESTQTATVTLKNIGTATFAGVEVNLVPPSGSEDLNWIELGVPSQIGNVAIGESFEVTLLFKPNIVSEGLYEYILRVTGNNGPSLDIPIYVTISSSETGGVKFHVSDIYTKTLDENGDLIQGVDDAKIRIQNANVLTLVYDTTTSGGGYATFENIPVGRYNYRITAPNHNTASGTIHIDPGIIIDEEAFLTTSLITFEWEVVPVVIKDVYTITLKATFETDVPAPVLTCDPSSVTLPEMTEGDVYYGEFTLINHGLVRADEVNVLVPHNDPYYSYEIPGNIPDSVEAKSKVVIPYRVVCKKSPSPNGDNGSGGAGDCHIGCISIPFSFVCANDVKSWGSTKLCFNTASKDCGDGGSIFIRAESFGGSGTSPDFSTVKGSDPCPPDDKPEDCDKKSKTGSGVTLITGHYFDSVVDLKVKINGGMATASRIFSVNQWYFGLDNERITYTYSYDEESFKFLKKGRVKYEKAGELGGDNVFEESELVNFRCGDASDNGYCYVPKNFLFKNRNYTIRTLGGYIAYHADNEGNPEADSGKFHCMGYLWQAPDGTWKKYDSEGKVISRGYNTVTLAQYEYNEEGKIQKVLDAQGNDAISYEYTDDLLTAAVDRGGNRVEYEYTQGRLTKVTDVLGNEWQYEYDSHGRLIKKTDPRGHQSLLTYDYASRVSSVVDENGIGKFFEYKFDELNLTYYCRVETSGGFVKEMWFDEDLDVKKVAVNGVTVLQVFKDFRSKIFIDHEGNKTIKKYNDAGRVTEITYPDGTVETFEYDSSGKYLVKHTDTLGTVTTYVYNERGLLIESTKDDGKGSTEKVEFSYDDYGNLLTFARIAPDDSQEKVTYEYDQFGNIDKKIDAEGNISTASYDLMGNPISVVDGRGNEWKQTFDARGYLKSKENPLGEKTIVAYDAVGNMISLTFPDASNPDGKKYELHYDSYNRLIEVVGPDGNSEKYEYNIDGKRTKFTDGEGKVTAYEYDTAGRLTKIIDGNGNEILYGYAEKYTGGCAYCGMGGNSSFVTDIVYPTYSAHREYDSTGRMILSQLVLDETTFVDTSYEYDIENRTVAVTDANGHKTTYGYDGFNKLKSITDDLGYQILFGFNWRGDTKSITDANGHTRSMEYDKNSRLIKEINPMGQEIGQSYDEVGNLVQKVFPDGSRIAYEYNSADRLTGIKTYRAGGILEKEISFDYDQVGTVTEYSDGQISAQCTYDQLERKSSETINYGSFTVSYNYQYYKNGKVKSFTVTDSAGTSRTFNYSYDLANNLSAIQIDSYGTVTYSNYLWKKPRKKSYPGGIEETLSYDNLLRLKVSEIKHVGTGVLGHYEYTYDKAGNIISLNRNGETISYTYDELYRLIGADAPGDNDETYTYDPAGNRLTDHRYPSQWSYDANNRLVSYGNVTLEYNENGALIEKKADGTMLSQYIYDVQNQLIEVRDENGSTVARYEYDPFGRRIKKEAGTEITHFLYSTEGVIAELDTSGHFKKVYVYEPGKPWSTAPVAMLQNDQCYFYHNSPIGTPLYMFSTGGELVWSATYESYGKATVGTGTTVINNLRLPGQYYDPETGLHYNFKRYYDPETGRYITEDPTRLKGSLNFYEYAKNNPLRYRDVTGEAASFGINGGIGPVGGGLSVIAVECCLGKYYNRYWLGSIKIGVGWITGVNVGVTLSKNEPGKCPPDTGCTPSAEIGLGIGPLGGSCDVTKLSCNGGYGISGTKIGFSFSAGVFLECKRLLKTQFVRCCD